MNLPNHLREYLAHLRSDARFQETMRAFVFTRLHPFPANGDPEKATTRLIYDSGRLAGEKRFMLEVLGHDPDDRQSE